MPRQYTRLMSVLIEAGQRHALKPEEIAARLSERDARQASDTRTPQQVLLAEPGPTRSALAGIIKVQQPSLFVPVKVKLGRSHTPNSNPAIWKFTVNR